MGSLERRRSSTTSSRRIELISLSAIKGGRSGQGRIEEEEELVASSSPLDSLLIKMGYKSEDGSEDSTRSLKEKLKSGR